MPKQYFLSGIGTEVGKTIASAVLVQYLKAQYWKPVQAGDLDNSDSHKVARLAAHPGLKVWPERYALSQPMSPHAAADIDGVKLQLADFSLPATEENLVVEGAGGLMVPLSEELLIIDLIAELGLGCVLVSRNYLGSINHSLLSIEALQRRNIPIAGIIFNGPPNEATESVILKRSGLPFLFRIPECPAEPDAAWIKEAANSINPETCPL